MRGQALHFCGDRPLNLQFLIDELKRQFQANDTEVIIGDDGVRETADKMVGRLEISMSFMFDVLNARREQPLDTDYDVEIDINSDEAVAIRLYLGDAAREQPAPDVPIGGLAPIIGERQSEV